MIPPNKLQQLLVNLRFRKRHGDLCMVCGRRENLSVHHILPKRSGGTNDDYNLICLCKTHHKLADRATLDEFAKIRMLYQPRTREGLVDFIRLVEESGTQTHGKVKERCNVIAI